VGALVVEIRPSALSVKVVVGVLGRMEVYAEREDTLFSHRLLSLKLRMTQSIDFKATEWKSSGREME